MQRISVITVVYNDIDKIEITIKNVLKQTYNDIEYIVVDGASTDGTTDVIRRYDGKIKWISEPDKGIYDAMMKGVRMASGEWILFHNSGDFFFSPLTLEELMKKYEKDNGEDFLIGKSRFFKSWGYKDTDPVILYKSYFEEMPVQHPSTLIRRTTQLKYPFHLEYKNSADYCFFVEAFRNGATYRFFDQIVSLIDSSEGATADNYEVTLLNNIDFLSKMKAPPSRIIELKKILKKVMFLKKYRVVSCLYNLYIENLRATKRGWVKCDISETLSSI